MSVVETLLTLIDIPSVTGTEARICSYIEERMRIHFESVERVGDSLVVGRPTGKPLVTLVGHTDTVPPQGNESAHVSDGRMTGLGTADMKAGLAAMIHALEDGAVRGGSFDVVGVFYAGEEGPYQQNELEAVLDEVGWLAESDLAIVMEPTSLAVEPGCQGVANAWVRFVGESAHSARPWLGENAVTRAGAWLAKMHQRTSKPIMVGGLEFKESITVTKANGGIAHNIVPPLFSMNLNYRYAPDKTIDEAIAVLREVAADADEFEMRDAAPAGPVRTDHPLVQKLAQIAGGEMLPKLGWTDVARLATRGIPGVNFGPGDPGVAHRPDEFVELAEVERCLVMLKELLA